MFQRFLLAVLIWLWSFPFLAKTQPPAYNFSKVDIENGLSHNQVFSIYRDSTGFVWFGTNSGLNRFDGYNFKVFLNNPSDSSSLIDNSVNLIFPFPGNKLLVSSRKKCSVFDLITGKVDRNVAGYLKALGLPNKLVNHSFKDKNGAYWFLFDEGLFKYELNSGPAVKFDISKLHSPQSRITHFCEDESGKIWVILASGFLARIDAKSLQIEYESPFVANYIKGTAFEFRVFADNHQTLWTYINGEPKGLFKFVPSTNELTVFNSSASKFRLNDNMIEGVLQDRRGDIWVGTDRGGVNIIDDSDNTKITYLTNKENDKNSLSFNSVEKLYLDDKGVIWIGTGKRGVNWFNQNIIQFEVYQHKTDDKTSLPFNDVNCFAEDNKGNIWIGSNGGGLIHFDRSSRRFEQYLNDPADSNSLSNNVVVSLYPDHEGKLWIGTYLGGLNVFDGKKFSSYRHNPADPNSISDDRIWHIMEDRNRTLWIGTMLHGLNRYDRNTNSFAGYTADGKGAKSIHSNYVPVIREDLEGNLWIGTSDGIEVLNKERTHFTYYPPTNKPDGLCHQDIHDIAEDRNGFIWIGTRNGLHVFNKQTGKFKHFTSDDGLPDNTVLTTTFDKKGNLWITTPKGLSQLMISYRLGEIDLEARNFTESNNLQGRAFNEKASMLSSDGLLFLGGATGFNILDPQKVIASNSKPSLVFTNIDIFNNEVAVGQSINRNIVLRKAPPFATEIVLSHTENIFSIEFAALDFSGNNQYAYKLEGFNKNWVYTNSGNRKITYTNIDPGTYYFKVKATNSDGVWSTEEKSLKIVIKPPFWITPLAFLLYAVVLIGILYIARRYTLEKAHMRFEVEQQRKERERIQSIDAVKTKFFTNVSHEFRTPLSLILSPLDRIINHTADPEQKKQVQLVQRNAKRLLNLVNQLLDFRKMEVQDFKLQPSEGDIVRFVRELVYSFSDISEMKSISLKFSSDLEGFLTFFDKDKLEKIIFNLLSNAFKYTPSKGSVEVEVSYSGKEADTEEQILITVKDSGIGIPLDKQEKIFERFFQNDVPANITNPGTGIGLAITKEFVKLHNGTISVLSEPEHGTSFIVSLPVKKLLESFVLAGETRELIAPFKQENGENGTKHIKKKRDTVLLVEDNDDFRFYLKDNLQQQYDVIEAFNGQEAWEKLVHVRPDLIVSDVMMPYMDGIELTKKVKKDPALASIPVILLTAVGDEDMQLESYQLGVSDYMTKPFTYEILAFRIKNILATAKQNNKKLPRGVEVNPSEVRIEPADDQFIKQALEVVEKNIAKPDFTVEDMSRELFMHRAGLYRKLLSLTGLTPLEFIRNIRLKRGRQLLEKSQMTISEIAYEVGFNNPKKFSQHFKEEFEVTPSQFQKQHLIK